MTDQELQRLEALAVLSGPAPWKYFDDGLDGYIEDANGNWVVGGERHEGRIEPYDPNGIFIVVAREAVPELCAELRRERKISSWLVEKIVEGVCPPKFKRILDCTYKGEDCVSCWREAAEEAAAIAMSC